MEDLFDRIYFPDKRSYRLSIFLTRVDHKVEATVEPTIGQVELSNLAAN